MKKAACRWCNTIVSMPDAFDPKDTHKDAICCAECQRLEQAFMLTFSDSMIGQRNLKEFGINPNERGKRDGQPL